jgi:hypothetical protein
MSDSICALREHRCGLHLAEQCQLRMADRLGAHLACQQCGGKFADLTVAGRPNSDAQAAGFDPEKQTLG